RSAMSAALGSEGDRHGALRTVLCRWRRRDFCLPRKTIHLLDDQENHERHDQKIDHVVEEEPVVKRCPWWVRSLGHSDRIVMCSAQVDEQSRKIDLTHKLPDGRHEHILDE